MEEETFIRKFEIPAISDSLNFYQKVVGDVSCVVWDASIVLAKYLENRFKEGTQFLKDSRVLELGAGLGCVGLMAACLGANVVSSDLPECLPLLHLNISQNRTAWSKYGKINTLALDWGENSKLGFIPDKILLADCVYYEESINPLIKTLVNLAGLETEILVCQEMRESLKQQNCWKKFMSCLDKYFSIRFVPLSEQDQEYCSPDIILIQLKKRSNMEYMDEKEEREY